MLAGSVSVNVDSGTSGACSSGRPVGEDSRADHERNDEGADDRDATLCQSHPGSVQPCDESEARRRQSK